MIDNDLAAELDALAQAIARMRPPQNHKPDAFHEDRSELAQRARLIAARMRTGPAAKPAAAKTPAPVGRQTVSHDVRTLEGRDVQVQTRRAAFLAH